MPEGTEVAIKVIETKKIPIDKIQLRDTQARQSQVTKNLEIFAEQIRDVGLIQPIVVYPVGDKYELIVGQRRYYAHKNVLQWDEILAMIIEKPKDDMMATTISWLENEARQKMQAKDKIRHVINMYAQKYSMKEIGEQLGIKINEVKACIGLPRVPDIVREAVERGEISADVAIKATDAKRFEKGDTSEEAGNDVLDLAKKIFEHKLKDKQIKSLVNYGKENPGSDNTTLLNDGIINTMEQVTVDLQSSDMKRLTKYAENNDQNKASAAANLILEGLEQSGD